MVEHRKAARLTQAVVAESMGVLQQTVHYIESGKIRLTMEHFLLYCLAVSVDPLTLLWRADANVLDAAGDGSPSFPG